MSFGLSLKPFTLLGSNHLVYNSLAEKKVVYQTIQPKALYPTIVGEERGAYVHPHDTFF